MSVSNLLREDARPALIPNIRQLPPEGTTARRWAIWSLQSRQGTTPCFATETRFTCGATRCRWWSECQDLKAEWRR